jgi:hypothetical protein
MNPDNFGIRSPKVSFTDEYKYLLEADGIPDEERYL